MLLLLAVRIGRDDEVTVDGQCDRPVDLMVLLDHSASVKTNCNGQSTCWFQMLDFVSSLGKSVKVGAGDGDSRVGVVTFGGKQTVEFALNKVFALLHCCWALRVESRARLFPFRVYCMPYRRNELEDTQQRTAWKC